MIKSTYYKYKNNELLKAVAVYTTLSFVIKGISFLITPFFTHYITPEEFGSLNLFLTSIIFLTPIISVSSNSITNNYFNESREIFAKKTSTYLTFSLIITLALIIITIIFSKNLTSYFSLPLSILIFLPIITYLNFLFDVVIILSRNESNKKRVFFSTLIKTILEIGLSVFFIMYLNLAGIGRIFAFCLSNVILSIWAIYFLIKKYGIGLKFNTDHIKEEYKFWFSLIIVFLFILSSNVFDKYIVHFYYNNKIFGCFSFANQLGSILLSFTGSIMIAFQPTLINILKEKKAVNKLKRHFNIINFSFIVFSILLYLFYWVLFKHIINNKYSDSWQFVLPSILIFLLWSFINNIFFILNYLKKTKVLFYLGVASMLILLPFEFLFTEMGIFYLFLVQISYLTIIFFILNTIIFRRKKIHFN